MLTVDIFRYVFNMMAIARIVYAHVLPCISIYFIERFMKLIDKYNIEITL